MSAIKAGVGGLGVMSATGVMPGPTLRGAEGRADYAEGPMRRRAVAGARASRHKPANRPAPPRSNRPHSWDIFSGAVVAPPPPQESNRQNHKITPFTYPPPPFPPNAPVSRCAATRWPSPSSPPSSTG
jgi:hypothetical protein